MIYGYFFVTNRFTHTFFLRKRYTRFFCCENDMHFVQKVFAHWDLPSGKFTLFGTLHHYHCFSFIWLPLTSNHHHHQDYYRQQLSMNSVASPWKSMTRMGHHKRILYALWYLMRHNAERIQNIQKPRINRSLHVTINNHLKLGCAVLAHINTTTELECIKICGSEKA